MSLYKRKTSFIVQKTLKKVQIMPDRPEYEKKMSLILKSEIKRAGLTYSTLTDKLNDMGIEEKEANVRNKIGRGKFSAAFMAECMDAIGITELRL